MRDLYGLTLEAFRYDAEARVYVPRVASPEGRDDAMRALNASPWCIAYTTKRGEAVVREWGDLPCAAVVLSVWVPPALEPIVDATYASDGCPMDQRVLAVTLARRVALLGGVGAAAALRSLGGYDALRSAVDARWAP